MDVKKQYQAYKKWVIENPKSASELETVVKWGSYLLAGE